MLEIIASVVSILLFVLLVYIVRSAKTGHARQAVVDAKNSSLRDKAPAVHEQAA